MFSENLREAMYNKRINQVKLAQISGISKSAISQYLAGKNVPTKERQAEIAMSMGLPASYFDESEAESDVLESMSASDVAKAMGKSLQFVYQGLQQGIFPWGYGVKMAGGQWSYFINAVKFRKIECM
ncbi:MAG: helix-turn-helix domain-containing protein, partial [Lachnospiraceae bacterium]